MWELALSPAEAVAQANETEDPVRHLVSVLDHITGYREDPLRKKSMLLCLILGQRPERFIDLSRSETVAPVVDYHIMRSCLRTGLVEAGEENLRELLVGRRLLKPSDEMAVRVACYDAILQLRAVSGRDLGAIDYFFFSARKRCPEMDPPDCARCPIDPVCEHDTALFQPVYRTTSY